MIVCGDLLGLGGMTMKKNFVLLIVACIFFFSACDNTGNVLPTPPEQLSSSPKQQLCKNAHSFAADSNLCTVCGAEYYAETLEFTLADTRDYYIVSSIGTCTRTIIKVPESYKGKPVAAIAENAFSGITESTSLPLASFRMYSAPPLWREEKVNTA